MLVHEPARARVIVRGDARDELTMRIQHAQRDRARERAISRRPRYVLQRDELVMQYAIARRVGDRKMELEAQAGEPVDVADVVFGFIDQFFQA